MDNSDLVEIIQVNQIKRGTLVLYDDVVCKVLDYHTAKPGKHGAAKLLIKSVELFSGKNKDISLSTSGTAYQPIVTRKEYMLVAIDDDNYMQLLDDIGEMVENIQLNDNDVSKQIYESFANNPNAEFTVCIMHLMNQTLIDSFKMKNN